MQRAETIAETPEEHEQLLKDRIATYQQAGTLDEQIARLESEEATAKNFRTLAMMHAAAGQLTEAEQAIRKAINQTPDDPNVLLVAAELAERQNRFSDAAETVRKL